MVRRLVSRFVALFTALVFTLTMAVPAFAQDPTPSNSTASNVSQALQLAAAAIPQKAPSEPDVGKAISPMKMGQKAPFTGVLLSPEAVASIIADYDHDVQACDIRVKKEVDTANVNCAYQLQVQKDAATRDASVCAATQKAQSQQIDTLNKDLKAAQDNQHNPYVWLTIGGVGGILLTTGIAFLVTRATSH